MARGADEMLATVAHASPYAYFRLSRGDVRVKLPAPGERLDTAADARVLALDVRARPMPCSAPRACAGSRSRPPSGSRRLPAGSGYFSAAALPDDQGRDLAAVRRATPMRSCRTPGSTGASTPRPARSRPPSRSPPGDGGRRQRTADRPVPAPVVRQCVGGRQARPVLRHAFAARSACCRPRSSRPNSPTRASCRTGPASRKARGPMNSPTC